MRKKSGLPVRAWGRFGGTMQISSFEIVYAVYRVFLGGRRFVLQPPSTGCVRDQVSRRFSPFIFWIPLMS